jgi:hypothetical protein
VFGPYGVDEHIHRNGPALGQQQVRQDYPVQLGGHPHGHVAEEHDRSEEPHNELLDGCVGTEATALTGEPPVQRRVEHLFRSGTALHLP